MKVLKLIHIFFAILILQGCKHPLSIVGEGDIVDLNNSGHGCTLEQFQSQDVACTENEVSGSYDVNYQAIPRPGWQFVRWEGPCSKESRTPICSHEVTAEELVQWEASYPGIEIPATVAVFEIIQTEFTEAEAGAIEALKLHRKARNESDAILITASYNYPYVHMGANNNIAIYETAEDIIDWEENIIIPFFVVQGFAYSRWNAIEIIQSGADKVHFKAQFSHFDADGNTITTGDGIIVVTNQGGHWGIQNRSRI